MQKTKVLSNETSQWLKISTTMMVDDKKLPLLACDEDVWHEGVRWDNWLVVIDDTVSNQSRLLTMTLYKNSSALETIQLALARARDLHSGMMSVIFNICMTYLIVSNILHLFREKVLRCNKSFQKSIFS